MKTSYKHRKNISGKPSDRQAFRDKSAGGTGTYAKENSFKSDQNTSAFVVPWQLYDFDPYKQNAEQKTM